MKLKIFLTVVLFYLTLNSSLAVKGKEKNITIHYDDDDSDVRNNVRFFLNTRKNNNAHKGEELYVNDTKTLKKTTYDVSLPTKFVTHGWNSSYLSPSSVYVLKALLKQGKYNVILVDWAPIASRNYSKSASKVRAAGNYVGQMIAFLKDQGTNLTSTSLIGHSMGAHIMGFAGKNLPNRRDGKVGHIVGLDPAGVGFGSLGANDRLSRDDAENVQIIHTNMGQSGISGHVGYSDFFVNGGGPNQPGCPDDDEGTCAHRRAYEYYAEALRNPASWVAIQCPNYDDFNDGKCKTNQIRPFPRWSGDFKAKLENYMLRTNDKSPYGIGIAGTQPAKQ